MASNFTKLISQQAQKEEEEKKKSGSASSEIIDILPQPSRSESTADQTYYDKTKDRYLQEDIVSTTTPKVTAKAPSFSASADLETAYESIQNSSTAVQGMYDNLTKRKTALDNLESKLNSQTENLKRMAEDPATFESTASYAKYFSAYEQYQKYYDLYNVAVSQYNDERSKYNAAAEQYDIDIDAYKTIAGNGKENASEYNTQADQLDKEAAELIEQASNVLKSLSYGAVAPQQTAEKRAYVESLQAQAQEKRDEAYALRQKAKTAMGGYYSIQSDAADFKRYSQVGDSKEGHAGDSLYDYINDIKDESGKGFRERVSNGPLSNEYATGDWEAYTQMTDNEIATYNYLYAKQGKEEADEFLRYIREALNQRQGAETFKNLSGVGKALYWVPQGLDQFGQGFKQMFNEDALPTSATQFTGQMVQQGITHNVGLDKEERERNNQILYDIYSKDMTQEELTELENGLKTGSNWGKWLAGAYELGVTVSNMMPSIMVSYVAGGLLSTAVDAGTLSATAAGKIASASGALTMGGSAGGNAYNMKLKEGWSKEQARSYAVLVGASEACLEYLIGGIDQLSGRVTTGKLAEKAAKEATKKSLSDIVLDKIVKQIAKLDNVFAKSALEFGARLTVRGTLEGLEEGLQEILEPIFAHILHGDEINIDIGNVGYAALMGFLAAGIFDIGDIVREVKASRTPSTGLNSDKPAYFGTSDIDWFEGCETLDAIIAKRNQLQTQYNLDQNPEIEAEIDNQFEMMSAFIKAKNIAESTSDTTQAEAETTERTASVQNETAEGTYSAQAEETDPNKIDLMTLEQQERQAAQQAEGFTGMSGTVYNAAQAEALANLSNDTLITAVETDMDLPYSRLGITEEQAAALRNAGLLETVTTESGSTFETPYQDAIYNERARRFEAYREARKNAETSEEIPADQNAIRLPGGEVETTEQAEGGTTYGEYATEPGESISAESDLAGESVSAGESVPAVTGESVQPRGSVSTESTAQHVESEAEASENAVGVSVPNSNNRREGQYAVVGRGRTGELHSNAWRTSGESIEHKKAARARQEKAAGQPLKSGKDIGYQIGSDATILRDYPEELWGDDIEAWKAKEYALAHGIKNFRIVLGPIQATSGGKVTGFVGGFYDPVTDTFVVRGDSFTRSISEIVEHEVLHKLIIGNVERVDKFSNAVTKNHPNDWQTIYKKYKEEYAKVTNDYVDMTPHEIEQYVWEEVMADAFSNVDEHGQQASKFHSEAVEAVEDLEQAILSQAGTEATPAGYDGETPGARGPPDTRNMYLGRSADRANSETLAEAEQLEQEGVDPETIRLGTGWFRGDDGAWRFEIDDFNMEYRRMGDAEYMKNPEYREYLELWDKVVARLEGTEADKARLRELDAEYKGVAPTAAYKISSGNAQLQDILVHDDLFANYPQLRTVGVRFDDLGEGVRGEYNPARNEIRIDYSLRNAPKSTLLHEIQHAIQHIEGFSQGANLQYWRKEINAGRQSDGRTAYDLYRHTAGEVEARDTASRGELTVEERRKTPPNIGGENVVFADGGEYLSANDSQENEETALPYDYSYEQPESDVYAKRRRKNKVFAEAERLEKAGESPEIIREKTGWFRSDNGEWQFEITSSDITAIQEIGKTTKSVNKFSSEEVKKTSAFASRFWRELGILSPYFRAWFGDWRANDPTPIEIVDVTRNKPFEAGRVKNYDTDRIISWGSVFPRETRIHQRSGGIATEIVGNIESLAQNAILLDTYASSLSSKQKMPGTAFIHSFYVLAREGRDVSLIKLYAEEALSADEEVFTRAYALKDIEKVATFDNGVLSIIGGLTESNITTVKSVSDLFELVKSCDANFTPEEPSKIVDEDGQPLVVYHGTQDRFDSFDPSKSRSNMDIQGSFFSPWEIDAGGYGENVGAYYLNLKNPAPENVAYRALNRFKGQNNAGKKARDYLISLGYDGVNNNNEEYIAFYPEQIKSAENNIGTFDKNDQRYRYAIEPEDPEYQDFINSIESDAENLQSRDNSEERELNLKRAADEFAERQAERQAEREATGPIGLQLPTEKTDELLGKGVYDLYANREPEATEPTPIPEGYESMDAYESAVEARAAAAQAERIRTISKDEFSGTDALDKLGVKIDGSVGNYSSTDELIKADRVAKQLQREIHKAELRLGATDAEKNFAAGMAAGIYSARDIPSSMNADVVEELADYYFAGTNAAKERLYQQKHNIERGLDEKMEALFKDSDNYKPSKALTLNYRTPERNMLHIFGDKQGEAINQAIFYPVAVNEAERFRFVNRMHDEVRKFENKNGKLRKLNKNERALVQMVIEGRAAAEMVAGMELQEQIQDAAANILNGADRNDAFKEFSLGAEEQKAAVQYARWLQTQQMLDSGKYDTVKIENAVKKYSQLFGEFYDAINDFLVAHGYEPIGFIKGYAPHMQPDGTQTLLNKVFNQLGINTDVTRLPTSIAGLTANFKPNKRWNPYFLQRTGAETEYDIATGFESYVDYMSDVLYHTDDTMRVRAAARYFRRTYAPEEIKNNLSYAQELRYGTAEQKASFLRSQGELGLGSALTPAEIGEAMDAYVEKLLDEGSKTTKYSDLVMWLDNYANILAGKQSMADRSAESMFGRTVLNVGNRLTRAFARANVAGSLSSMLNQSAQLPMIQAELGDRWVAAAIKDIVTGRTRKGEWMSQSDFLVGKAGIDYLVSTPGEMALSIMFKPAELMDTFVATVAVRGKYLQEIHNGKSHKEAMKAADRFGTSVMGSRMKGSKPVAFNSKNPLYQMVNIFQIEAFNSWEHIKEDLPRDFRTIEETQGKGKAAWTLGSIILKGLLLSFLGNRLADKLYGGTPMPFDLIGLTANFIASGQGLTTNDYLMQLIDNACEKLGIDRVFDTEPEESDDFDWGAAVEDTGFNVMNDVPFLRNVSGLLGLGDQTLPMPDLYGGGKNIWQTFTAEDADGYDKARSILEFMSQFMPGGRQIKKSVLGAETVLRGGDFSGRGENRKLKYPIDGDTWTDIQAILFGKYATEASNEYYAAGNSPLSIKQTKLWQTMVDAGADSQDIYNAILDYRALSKDEEMDSYERGVEQRDLLRNLDVSDDLKLQMYRELTSADSRTDKFEKIMDAGLSFDRVMDIYDKYAEIDQNEDAKAQAKATEFAKWLDKQKLSDKQKSTIRDQLKYWSIIPAEASRYDKLTGAGLEPEDAYKLTETLSSLAPEEGADDVSNMQQYRAIAASNLGENEKISAIGTVMGTDLYTESGKPSQYAKMLALTNYGLSIDQYLDLHEADVVDGYIRCLNAGEYGIQPETYIYYVNSLPDFDADGNSNYTQAEMTAAVSAIPDIDNDQRAVLWQVSHKNWKPNNNPWSYSVGASVYDAINGETDELLGLELPS